MANILSLAEVNSAHDVSINTNVDTVMYVHGQGKKIVLINFRPVSTTLILTTSMPMSRPIQSPTPTVAPQCIQINRPMLNKLVPARLTPILIALT